MGHDGAMRGYKNIKNDAKCVQHTTNLLFKKLIHKIQISSIVSYDQK